MKRRPGGKKTSSRRPGRDIPPELVERRCLACGKKFIAKGRFLRLCRIHRDGDPRDVLIIR